MPTSFLPRLIDRAALACLLLISTHNPGLGTDVATGETESGEILFEKHVRPIFKAHCFLCHGEEAELSGGLDVRLVRLMHTGGDSGSAIKADAPKDSLLLQRIVDDEMPPGPKKLSEAEKTTISKWLLQGAQTARAEPDSPDAVKFTAEELSHWAFQPPADSPIPTPHASPGITGNELTSDNPVDAFVYERLRRAGLSFADPADRITLLRRLKFDLHGLPPTAAEVHQFLADDSVNAFERLVDRLLASPQYGVRWARHWLDVVGYAESDGNITKDQPRPHAWHYRDYVINSLNNDKPYNEFLVEQLAGDELIDGSPDANNSRHIELLAATGLLRMAPDVTQTDNSMMDRNQAVADVLNVVGTGILGVTVGCAQCHDHRYDPISIEDYYRFRSIFDPAFSLKHWKRPTERLIDLTDDATRGSIKEIETQAVAIQEDINQRRLTHCQTIQDREIAKVPEELREEIRIAVNTEPAKQTDEQKKLLDRYPTVRSINWIVGQLVEYDRAAHQKFEEEQKQVAELRATKPLQRLLMAVSENRQMVPESHVFFRGNPDSPTEKVQPSEIMVLTSARAEQPIPDLSQSVSNSTGRRLAYAQQLTDGTHPTVARVLVNRVWLHHFGAGLVSTPGDFGLSGQPPSHPELLDWLANDFVAGKWSIKRLHKLILLSQTYRQSSVPADSAAAELDPDNRLLSHMSLRRMEAEVIRDSMLFVSDQLNLSLGGPSVPVTEDGEGKAVIGTQTTRNGLFDGVVGAGGEANRRSVYIATLRTLPLNLLQTFDLPEMTPNCQLRTTSTVAPQSLLFLNDPFVIDASNQLANRLSELRESPEARIDAAFQRLFGSLPSETQRQDCNQFLERQTEIFENDSDQEWRKQLTEDPAAAQRRALASLCQILMASNRFLYIQ